MSRVIHYVELYKCMESIQNEWSYTDTPPASGHSVDADILSFALYFYANAALTE
jgi:hypothetical protein